MWQPAPHIDFVEVAPKRLIAYQDSLTFGIRYTDNQGDVGENSAEAKNCFVQDLRNETLYPFRIPQLKADSLRGGVQGRLSITLPMIPCLTEADSETVRFCIWIQDRKGNRSNKVMSEEVVVRK